MYYEGKVLDALLNGSGKVWLFSKDSTVYFWAGVFINGYPSGHNCTATNFPDELNLFADLNLGLLLNLQDKNDNMFALGFTSKTSFIKYLLNPELASNNHLHDCLVMNYRDSNVASETPPLVDPRAVTPDLTQDSEQSRTLRTNSLTI